MVRCVVLYYSPRFQIIHAKRYRSRVYVPEDSVPVCTEDYLRFVSQRRRSRDGLQRLALPSSLSTLPTCHKGTWLLASPPSWHRVNTCLYSLRSAERWQKVNAANQRCKRLASEQPQTYTQRVAFARCRAHQPLLLSSKTYFRWMSMVFYSWSHSLLLTARCANMGFECLAESGRYLHNPLDNRM